MMICLVGAERNPAFKDVRTGHYFCHEHLLELVTWEFDGCPEMLDPDSWLTGYGATYRQEMDGAGLEPTTPS